MMGQLETEVDMLARHFDVLSRVLENQPIGIVRLSRETSVPKHRIRYSLRILEEEGLIEPTDRGAVPTEQASEFLEAHDRYLDEIIAQLETLAELSIEE
jgi:predicted transcriptional regulator